MAISILLTILLMMILFIGSFLQEGKIRLVTEDKINDFVTINYNLKNAFFRCAVKLVFRTSCLLNIVMLSPCQKYTQTTLTQLQNLKFEG